MDARIHQEVVTPTELMERILSFIYSDDINDKDVLDPCVGPGAMIKPVIEKYNPKSVTVCDIQKIHIDNFVKYCTELGYNIEKLETPNKDILDEW
jgi:predicted RNA methylase